MKNKLPLLSGFALFLFFISTKVQAQGTDNYGSGLKINLDTSGKKFVRIITWHQVWVRANENNPGSAINGEKSNYQWDMSMRRSRFLIYSQINSNFLILMHFGINNANQVSGGGVGQGANVGAAVVDGRKAQLFLHDAYVEHRIYKDVISVGAGLHYWQGPSRMSGTSTLNFLAMDSPIFSWQNIDATDQFARQYGMYLKGKLLKNKRVDYRLAMNFPFAMTRGTALGSLDTVSARRGLPLSNYKIGGQPKAAYTGYFAYQFKDIESNLLPFNVGTYVGTKKVFNIGAGFYHQKNAMWTAAVNAATNKVDTTAHTQFLAAADVFMDMPLGENKKSAVTLYASYTYVDMGKNFVRNIGINNPTNGTIASEVSYNGTGNAVPTIGTGNVIFAQAGFVFPKVNRIGRFQPYVSTTVGQYERIKDNVVIPDFGMNWFLAGHSAKITFNYRIRPVFTYENPAQRWSDVSKSGKKSEFTIQFQVYL
ncbi:hypothetical protein CNR22_00455 [Sphingobacteriaceae bacterium]|nr:hypothetical protein CNR22_00455 [Sphingobacteriaceae bacterium]